MRIFPVDGRRQKRRRKDLSVSERSLINESVSRLVRNESDDESDESGVKSK